MITNKQITHNQHYVWRKYLESWGHIEREKVFAWWNNKKVIKYTDLFDILREKNFYQFKPLNELEHFCLKQMFAKTKINQVKNANKALDRLIDTILLIDSIYDENEDFSKALIQAGETIETEVENSGIKPLELLKNEDLTQFNYNNDGIMIEFLIFVLFQYLRTKGIREKAIGAVANNDGELKRLYKIETGSSNDYPLDWNRVYNYGFLYTVNAVAYSMSAKQAHIRLLKTSGIKFIVSDQPVYNISEDPTQNFDLFYPITPEIAIIISDKYDANEIITISDNEVNDYNLKTLRNAHDFIIGYEKSYVDLHW